MKKKVALLLLGLITLSLCFGCSSDAKLPDDQIVENDGNTIDMNALTTEILEKSEISQETKEIILRANNYEIAKDIITTETSSNVMASFRFSYLPVNPKPKKITIEEIDNESPIQCLRVTEDFIYSIHRIEENHYFYSFYTYEKELSTYILQFSFYDNGRNYVKNFLDINYEHAKSELVVPLDIDPTMTVLYLSIGESAFTMTADGFLVYIDCAFQGAIKDIRTSEFIEEPMNMLLPIDKKEME